MFSELIFIFRCICRAWLQLENLDDIVCTLISFRTELRACFLFQARVWSFNHSCWLLVYTLPTCGHHMFLCALPTTSLSPRPKFSQPCWPQPAIHLVYALSLIWFYLNIFASIYAVSSSKGTVVSTVLLQKVLENVQMPNWQRARIVP